MLDKRITPHIKAVPGEEYINKLGVKHIMPQGQRFSSTNQPTPEAKSAGCKRFSNRKRLANDILSVLVEDGTMKRGLDVLNEQVDKGDVSNLMKVLPIITPKNVDLTSDGERVVMGDIVLDGAIIEPTIGEDSDSAAVE